MPTGTTATAGNDWCFQIETDLSPNWWAFQPTTDGQQVTFNQIQSAARIKLMFQNRDTGNTWGFASIFIALDATGTQPAYPTTEFRALHLSTNPPDPPPANIVLPSGGNSKCMSFADFLAALLPQGINFKDSPTCNVNNTDTGQGGCGTTNVAGPTGTIPIRNKLVGAVNANPNGPKFYWNFNGHTHAIAGAVRILVDVSGAAPVYLTIGYGGNSGAG